MDYKLIEYRKHFYRLLDKFNFNINTSVSVISISCFSQFLLNYCIFLNTICGVFFVSRIAIENDCLIVCLRLFVGMSVHFAFEFRFSPSIRMPISAKLIHFGFPYMRSTVRSIQHIGQPSIWRTLVQTNITRVHCTAYSLYVCCPNVSGTSWDVCSLI